jgi:hypothetical protein
MAAALSVSVGRALTAATAEPILVAKLSPPSRRTRMNRTSTKTTAESVLRELPSVLGAYVSEDLEGKPREIHLLVSAGPDLGALARDVRGLLQERLGMPIDQRIISIAQLAPDPTPTDTSAGAQPATPAPASAADARVADARPVFGGLESTVASGHVTVGVRLEWQGAAVEGTAEAADTTAGRARAAATATLRSAMAIAGTGAVAFELDFASIVQALDGDYVLVSVLGLSNRMGRRPLPLVGAHPIESDVEPAAAFAALKAVNRVLSLALQEGPSGADQ